MSIEVKVTKRLNIQTLKFVNEEWIKIDDIIAWLRAHCENGFLPKEVGEQLVLALTTMKNPK